MAKFMFPELVWENRIFDKINYAWPSAKSCSDYNA